MTMTEDTPTTAPAAPPAEATAGPGRSEGSTFETLAVTGFIFGLFAIAIALFALGMAARAVSEADGGGGTADGGGGSGGGATVTEIAMTEFAFDPSDPTVAAGTVLQLRNDGAIVHNLSVDGVASDMVDSGETGELDLSELAPGTYEMQCDVPGHAAAGMVGTMTIE
jgi:plastocyanin